MMLDETDSLNSGIVASGECEAHSVSAQQERTLVVTGVARSGTSMMAALLRASGVFMGDQLLAVVDEDAEILSALTNAHAGWLDALIARRNKLHSVWGFKVPNLHALMPLSQFALMRNPRLIVIVRDPVAVAVRHALSEHLATNRAMTQAADSIASMMRFAEGAGCPVLYLSYEKVIAFPTTAVRQVLEFCGLPFSEQHIVDLIEVVRPNNLDYRATAKKKYEGCIDGIYNGWLQGWCRVRGSTASLQIEVWAGLTCLGVYEANQFRDDLQAAGIGNGNHAFQVDIARLGLPADTILRAQVHGRTYVLKDSGRTIASYIATTEQRIIMATPSTLSRRSA